MVLTADFSGYATKVGIRCTDGRTIMPDAFKHMDGARVPLVWQHGHTSPNNVLGHAILKHRADGIYAYGYFNDTPQGNNAKALVEHKDIDSLSIFANQLVERSKQVFHGIIRELSLTLAGANPGAHIDNVNIAHADGGIEELEDEVIIYTGLPLEHETLSHDNVTDSDNSDEDDSDEDDETDDSLAHVDDNTTVQDIYDSLTEEQKNVVHYMIGMALQQATQANQDSVSQSSVDFNGKTISHEEGTTKIMGRNVFEMNGVGATQTRQKHELSHDDIRGILNDAAKLGSLHDAVDNYVIQHGIDNIDVLFPDAQTIDAMPMFNKRRTEWVQGVLDTCRHSPFSRVKTITADLTQAEARAKGYIKGNYKIEEWFAVTKRVTTPTTIYKKQKLDRDDVVDITSFDVIAWIKAEMRIMLEEELARAILISDGRDIADPDRIKDPVGGSDGSGIRSILYDHELFVTTVTANVLDANSSYDEVVDVVMDGMAYYLGTGVPTLYTTIAQLNKFFKIKDTTGRRIYKNKAEVAEALGVRDIITVDVMNEVPNLVGIIVNLADYNLGADRGGEVNFFDDFDIDYNQMKYLTEARLSGGLVKMKSAVVVKVTSSGTAAALSAPTAPTYDSATAVVTIPTMTNVTYKNADTGDTLTAGAQAALTVGTRLNVQAVANTGYFFPVDNADTTLWSFYHRS